MDLALAMAFGVIDEVIYWRKHATSEKAWRKRIRELHWKIVHDTVDSCTILRVCIQIDRTYQQSTVYRPEGSQAESPPIHHVDHHSDSQTPL